ncbi:MAG: prepilin peptidase [Patescibacteria group bacterium]
MAYIILFVLGSIIGSFINVITLRYNLGDKIFSKKNIGGRSHCLYCNKQLVWYELLPIFSFLIQKGKCRNCHNKLFLQYPLIEILNGLIFVFIPFYLINFQSIIQLSNYQLLIAVIWILIFELFLLLSIIDFRHYIIPDQINLLLGILGLILIFINNRLNNFDIITGSFIGHYAAIFGIRENIFINHIFASFLAMAFLGIIIIASRGRGMGWGDFKLVGALGLIFGWPDILMIILLSFIIGAIFVFPLLIKRKKTMKDIIPFGPFLIIASAVVFFFGYKLTDFYFGLFNLTI